MKGRLRRCAHASPSVRYERIDSAAGRRGALSAPHVRPSTLRCGRTGGFARRANITRADRVGPVRLASGSLLNGLGCDANTYRFRISHMLEAEYVS